MGHDVHIIPLKGKLELLDEFAAQGCVVHVNAVGINPLLQAVRIMKLQRLIKPEVIHAHLPRAELILSILITKSLKIVSKHNTEIFFPNGNKVVSRIMSKFVEYRSNEIITISKAVKRFLIQSGELKKSKKLHTVLYGMNQEVRFDDKAKKKMFLEFGVPEGTKIFGTISRLAPQKDLKTQLTAFNSYLQLDPNALLVVIGEGPLQSELEKEAKALGCDENIIWYGKTPYIAEALQIFDVFLLSSLYEGLGLVLLEAIASKVPILASNNSAIPEVLGNDFPGLFVTSNSENLFSKMKQTDDEGFCLQLLDAQEAREKIFEPSVMARNIQAVYEGASK
jgi:glycosyltransferase involved in cell wall biosynthesis